jgi:hypothetical protein
MRHYKEKEIIIHELYFFHMPEEKRQLKLEIHHLL